MVCLEQYIAELRKIQLLTPEQEAGLWQGFKESGDMDCRRELIEHYQPLVFKAVMQFSLQEATAMDAVQEGTVGLIEAVENYDHKRGVAFSLYAFHRIRGRIVSFLTIEGKLSCASLDADEYGTGRLVEQLADEKADVSSMIEHNFLVDTVREAMDNLPPKEQLVLDGVYLKEQEPRQLANDMDISISHVYRLQKQGVRRVRGMLSRMMKEMKTFCLW